MNILINNNLINRPVFYHIKTSHLHITKLYTLKIKSNLSTNFYLISLCYKTQIIIVILLIYPSYFFLNDPVNSMISYITNHSCLKQHRTIAINIFPKELKRIIYEERKIMDTNYKETNPILYHINNTIISIYPYTLFIFFININIDIKLNELSMVNYHQIFNFYIYPIFLPIIFIRINIPYPRFCFFLLLVIEPWM